MPPRDTRELGGPLASRPRGIPGVGDKGQCLSRFEWGQPIHPRSHPLVDEVVEGFNKALSDPRGKTPPV